MHRVAFLLVLCGCVTFSAGADAGPFRYPRVYGPTGRPYGPTRAHEQYQRQYGRPWHGYGGLTAHGYRGSHFTFYNPPVYAYPSYGYGYAPYNYGWYGYGLVGTPGHFGYLGSPHSPYPTGYVYTAPSYNLVPSYVPPLIQEFPQAETPFENEVLFDTLRENEERWQQPLDLARNPRDLPRRAEPSLPEAQIRSLRYQAAGDTWFHKQNYPHAYNRYKAAVSAAGDRAEAQFRLAYALTAMGQYRLAVERFQLGLSLDPEWPQTGIALSEVFGEQNELAKDAVLHRVVAWTRDDVRDPDRLFLLGVLVHFDGNVAQAETLFETALRLAGEGEHLMTFLRAGEAPVAQPVGAPQEFENSPAPHPNQVVPQRAPARRSVPPQAAPPAKSDSPQQAAPPEPQPPVQNPQPAPETNAPAPVEVPAAPDEDATSGPQLQAPADV